MPLELRLCWGAVAAGLLGRALRGPGVLDAGAELVRAVSKRPPGAGGLPARGCGRAGAGFEAAPGPGSRGFGGQVRTSRLSRQLLAAALPIVSGGS